MEKVRKEIAKCLDEATDLQRNEVDKQLEMAFGSPEKAKELDFGGSPGKLVTFQELRIADRKSSDETLKA